MGNVDTTIGHDTIVVSGDVWVSPETIGDSLMGKRFFWSLVVGDVIMTAWIPQFGSGIHFAISSAGGPMGEWAHHWMDVSEVPEDGLEFSYSITVGGFHIRRSYGLDAMGMPARGRMKPNEANPSPNPTHSIEMYAADNWVVDTEPGVLNVRLGEVEWNGVNGPNPPPDDDIDPDPPDFYTVNVVPSDCLNVVFEGVYDLAAPGTYCTTSVSTNYLDYDFSLIDELVVIDPPTQRGVHVTGSGNTVNWWSDDGVDGEVGRGFLACPPAAVSWENYGLCDWGENTHNSRYDGVLVWGGFRKVPEMDGKITWPLRSETETPDPPPLSMSGDEFEYGEEVPVSLGELRALGTYVKPPKELGEPHFWGGPVVSLRVDRESHIKHNLYPKGDLEEHPLRFPIGINHLGSPLPSTDPHFDIPVSRFDVDADVPDGLSGRPTAWQANGFTLAGGGVDTSGDVEFTVAGGGTLSRTLRSNWLARCTALNEYGAATGNWAVFPAGYLVHRANYMRELHGDWDWEDIEAETGYVEEDEDVTYYSSHRYLQFALEGPEGADGTEMQVLLTYRVETVTDDHILDLTGPVGMREVECTLGPIQTLELEGIYDQHNSVLTVDMAEPPSALPDLRHVESVSIVFTDAHDGAWTLTGMRLVHADDEPVTLVTAHEPRQGYVAGGVRGVVNGLHPYALVSSGNYRTYGGQEQLVEHVNWYWTETLQLTQDGSAAWTLDDYLGILSGACEGWDWELPDDWEAMTTDHTEAVLSSGYSFDLAERQGEVVDETEEIAGAYPARLSAWRWRTAPQLLYKPRGVVCVQGGIHGLSDERSGTGGTVLYDGGQIAVGSDANGYYQCGVDVVRDYPEYWSYTLGDVRFLRTYERQYCAAYFAFPTCRQPHLALDDAGRVWLAANDGRNNVRVYWRPSPQRGWTKLTDAFDDQSHEHPCITPMHDGRLVVSATHVTTREVDMVESTDDGRSWHDLA